jgi:hypothetical protein
MALPVSQMTSLCEYLLIFTGKFYSPNPNTPGGDVHQRVDQGGDDGQRAGQVGSQCLGQGQQQIDHQGEEGQPSDGAGQWIFALLGGGRALDGFAHGAAENAQRKYVKIMICLSNNLEIREYGGYRYRLSELNERISHPAGNEPCGIYYADLALALLAIPICHWTLQQRVISVRLQQFGHFHGSLLLLGPVDERNV